MPVIAPLERNRPRLLAAVANQGERALWRGLALAIVALPLFMGGGLFLSARGLLTERTMAELFGAGGWNPARGEFSYLPALTGTLWVTLLALIMALPLSLAVALYTAEYAPPRFASLLKPLVDVLAGLPSVLFGLWGMIALVPVGGYTVLTAAFVLALMISPILIQVSIEIFQAVPLGLRQAAYALGATRWEVVRKVVLKKSLPGIVAAVVLALARAFGETLAVMMVVGGGRMIPVGPLSPASTLPTLIARGYGEMSSIPLYHEAFMGAAFILFLVVVGFTLASHFVLRRLKRGME